MILKYSQRKKNLRTPLKENAPATLEYRDKRQVDLDISRVSLSKAAAAKLEKRIGTVLAANKELHYYQGFHDVAMHTHNMAQLENLALQQLRDFMASSLHPTMQMLKLVPEILARADPDNIGAYFNGAPVDSRRLGGYFALAPVVTLFSHECSDSQVISPIIRTVLREGIAYVLYLYAALVITYGPDAEKASIASQSGDDDDDFEMSLQGVAAKLNAENYPELDKLARKLRSKFPLKRLQTFQQVSRFSVLKSGKVTKRTTAIYMLNQLEHESSNAGPLHSRTTAVLVAVSAIAFGMLWTKMHRN